jgi:hypothetical protein
VRAGDDDLDSVASNHPIAETKSLIEFSGKGKNKSIRNKTNKAASQQSASPISTTPNIHNNPVTASFLGCCVVGGHVQSTMMKKACSKRRPKRAAEFMIPGACVAVKMSRDLFARGILKDDDRPLDDQTGAFAVLLDGEADLRYVAPIKLYSIHSCSVCHTIDDVAGVKVLWCRTCPLGYC